MCFHGYPGGFYGYHSGCYGNHSGCYGNHGVEYLHSVLYVYVVCVETGVVTYLPVGDDVGIDGGLRLHDNRLVLTHHL